MLIQCVLVLRFLGLGFQLKFKGIPKASSSVNNFNRIISFWKVKALNIFPWKDVQIKDLAVKIINYIEDYQISSFCKKKFILKK